MPPLTWRLERAEGRKRSLWPDHRIAGKDLQENDVPHHQRIFRGPPSHAPFWASSPFGGTSRPTAPRAQQANVDGTLNQQRCSRRQIGGHGRYPCCSRRLLSHEVAAAVRQDWSREEAIPGHGQSLARWAASGAVSRLLRKAGRGRPYQDLSEPNQAGRARRHSSPPIRPDFDALFRGFDIEQVRQQIPLLELPTSSARSGVDWACRLATSSSAQAPRKVR
jgi:hypothetical protein